MDLVLRSWLAALPENPASLDDMMRSLTTDRWSALLNDALVHGVLGVVAPYVDRPFVPQAVRDEFARRHAIFRAFQGSVVASFETIVQAFDAAAIRVCSLKGPALSARLYGDATTRSSMDVDLLIAPSDFDRAVQVMRDLGYSGKSDATVAYLLRHGHHLRFARAGSASVELHFRAYAGFGVNLPAAALMDRAVAYRFSDATTILVPSPEDEFIYLAVHAAGHSFARLFWLYDLKLLVLRHPEIDWDAIASRSEAANVFVPVGFAIRLLKDWLNVPLGKVVPRFSKRGIRLGAADVLLPFASRISSPSSLDNLKGLVFTAMLCDRPRSTVWLLQHHVLRSARRRVHRLAPAMLPQSWSG